jgi:putative transposase
VDQHGARIEFYPSRKADRQWHLESFNGRLRDECLNVETCFGLSDVREKLERWCQDYLCLPKTPFG